MSASAIARFADAHKMTPGDAATFVKNASPEIRQAIAQRYADTTSDDERRAMLAESDARRADSLAIRMAVRDGNLSGLTFTGESK